MGGFDESLPTNFNDVAFCRSLIKAGYINIVCAVAELQHIEGFTRNENITNDTFRFLRDEGIRLNQLHPEHDPYWNPNLQICMVQGGKFVAGMDMNIFSFPPPDKPWEKPTPEKILLIGSDLPLTDERNDGAAIFQASIAGYMVVLSSPPMTNCGPWDIRYPAPFSKAMHSLGIDRIVLTKLSEFSQQTLPFLIQTGIKVEYRPVNGEAICPRGDFKIPENDKPVSCNKGYTKGACQNCLLENSSPQGMVNPASWLINWGNFFGSGAILNLDCIDEESLEAYHHIYLRKPEAAE